MSCSANPDVSAGFGSRRYANSSANLTLPYDVSSSAFGHDNSGIIDVGGGHPERLEDRVVHELAIGLSRDFLNHEPKDERPAAVAELCARGKLQGRGLECVQELCGCGLGVEKRVRFVPVISQSRSVVHQLK